MEANGWMAVSVSRVAPGELFDCGKFFATAVAGGDWTCFENGFAYQRSTVAHPEHPKIVNKMTKTTFLTNIKIPWTCERYKNTIGDASKLQR
jgi:hypothetical protein